MTMREALENAVDAYTGVGIIDSDVSSVRIALRPLMVMENGLEKVDGFEVAFSCRVNPIQDLRDDLRDDLRED